MEFSNLTDKEFKMIVCKKLNELQENSERQFNETRKNIHEQNEICTKEMAIIKNTDSEAEEFNELHEKYNRENLQQSRENGRQNK